MSILGKIFGDANERYIKSLEPIVAHINELEKEFQNFSDEQLRAKTDEFKKRLSDPSIHSTKPQGGEPVESTGSGQVAETLDDILPEAFAAVREASKRTLGL